MNRLFALSINEKALTTSDGNKATTIRFDNLILTTLDLNSQLAKIDDFIDGIGLGNKDVEIPNWLKDYDCFDDKQQKEIIVENKEKITTLKAEIKESEEKLKINEKYKSILITNSDALVTVVFEMLEKMLKCDLSTFVDEKKEDFVIKKEKVTFVGEIKGINSNVGFNNISQAERHKAEYWDVLARENKKENVKALLVINPLRKTPVTERENINEQQIEYAKKHEVLIITTEIFLHLYEKFLVGEISSENIIDVLVNKTGLLTLEDF